MAPERWLACALRALVLVVLISIGSAPAAHALRIVDYNITNYPGVLFPQRQPYFRTIMAPLNADIMVCQEVTTQAGVDSFRINVLNVIEPGQWASAPFFNGNDTDNALFYKPAKVQFLGAWPFYPNPANLLRYVTVWRLKPVGYSSSQAEFRIYSQHLKASTGFESQRLAEATGIRDSMNHMPSGTNAIVLGDWNFYKSSTEPGYAKLQEVQASNIGRVFDPLNPTNAVQDWHDNAAFVNIHTQCPCVTCPAGSGFSGGGIDDRFDQLLPTLNMGDGQGLDIVPGSYIVVGQDGQHFNKNITDAPVIPEGAAYATALWNASDHLPSRIDIQLPAKISVPASIAFGSVLVGASVTQNLPVTDAAPAPADALTYGMAPDFGFTAPGGTFNQPAGAAPALQPIGMDTSTPGSLAGQVLISSDDPDSPLVAVDLSGTVLAHAQASLDSSSALLAQSLDFGTQAPGGFSTLMARVHDRGYTSLRARLAVNSGAIVGGDGRFSIVGGFSPVLVAGVAHTFTVQFNDAGATPDQDYNATLTFASADEPLPGATAQPALTVSLHARMTGSAVGVPVGTILPTATRLYPPTPNPTAHGARIHFDLAREADLRLDVFDLSGRRVATIAEGARTPGQYDYPWDGRAEGGATLGSGLFFVRLSIAGEQTRIARLVVLR